MIKKRCYLTSLFERLSKKHENFKTQNLFITWNIIKNDAVIGNKNLLIAQLNLEEIIVQLKRIIQT